MRSFVTIISSRNGEIILLFTDEGKQSPSCEFLTSQICLLPLFAKTKFWHKLPNLQKYVVILIKFWHSSPNNSLQELPTVAQLLANVIINVFVISK